MGADGFAGDAGYAQFVAQGGDALKFHGGFLTGVVKKSCLRVARLRAQDRGVEYRFLGLRGLKAV